MPVAAITTPWVRASISAAGITRFSAAAPARSPWTFTPTARDARARPSPSRFISAALWYAPTLRLLVACRSFHLCAFLQPFPQGPLAYHWQSASCVSSMPTLNPSTAAIGFWGSGSCSGTPDVTGHSPLSGVCSRNIVGYGWGKMSSCSTSSVTLFNCTDQTCTK